MTMQVTTKDGTSVHRAPPKDLTISRELIVQRLGFGAMHLTGKGMWGDPPDPEAAIRVLRRAVELGVNFLDTADAYGPGNNEQIIRRALHPYPDDLVISTKGGLLRSGPKDWSLEGPPYIVPCGRPAYLRQQVELSLRNLGVDCIKLYQLHAIDPTVPLADQLGELIRLREQGKIRHIGLSGQPAVKLDDLVRSRELTEIASVESLYNLVDRTDDTALEYAESHDIAYVPWFPLGHGELTRPNSPLAPLARQFDLTPAQLALAWLLHRSPATLLIPGTTSLRHLEENMKAREVKLTTAEMREITSAVDALQLKPFRPTP
ncbi:MAG TPA: aldo/keto reductase [Polyangiales bacterium]|nr:aldo/keto reductase [Polyangiales bacterium]